MAYRQSFNNISGGTATPTSSFQDLPQTGSFILVAYSSWNGGSPPATPTIQDNQGGTTSDYILIASQVTPSGSDDYRHAVFYRNNISAPSGTFTVTVNQGGAYNCSIFIAEFNEVPTSSPIEQTANTTGTSSTPSIALAGATTAAKALIVGCISHNSGNPTLTNDATNLPILIREYEDNASTEAMNLSIRRVASTGSYTVSWAVGASVPWSALGFALKQTGTAVSSLVGMSAPAFTATSGANLSPALPVGWIADDIGLLVGWRADTTAGTQPTNWTNISALTGNSGTQRVEVYWRRMVGGDSAPTFTFGSGTVVRGARIYMIGGCPTSGDPWDTLSKLANTTADATTEFTDISTTAANEVALALGFHDDDITAATLISGWRKPWMYTSFIANQPGHDIANSTLGNDLGHFVQFRDMGSAGSVGTATVTVTGSNAVSTGIAISFQVAVSGTTLPVSIGGTLTLAGALVKQDNKTLAGTLTTAGALAKQTSRALSGALTAAGALAKQVPRALAGTLSLAGAADAILVKLVALGGTLTAAGALAKQTNKVVGGALTTAGVVAKQIAKPIAGTLAPVGALAKQVGKPLAGALTSSGALAVLKVKVLAVSGALTAAGALAKQVAKPLAGTLTTAGAVAKQVQKPLSGALTSSGALGVIKVKLLAVAGSLGLAGAVAKQVSKPLAGTLTTSGAVAKGVSRALSGTLTTSGSILRTVARAISGALSLAGGISSSTTSGGDDYSADTIARSPWVYYRLNEASGTLMEDSSGNSRDGVYSGTITDYQAPALITTDTAIEFGSDGAGVLTSGSAGYANLSTWTVEGWVTTLNNPGDHAGFFGSRTFGHGDLYCLQLTGTNRLEARFIPSSGIEYTLDVVLTPDTRTYIALVYDGSTFKCYINGQLGDLNSGGTQNASVSATGQITFDDLDFAVGRASGWHSATTVDEVAIFQTALSSTDIADRWALGTTTLLPFRDDFTAAPDAFWTEADSQSVLAVENERAAFAYTSSLDVWDDPALVSGEVPRADMGALTALVRLTNQMDADKGFKVALSPSASDPDASGAGVVTVAYPTLRVPSQDEPASPARQRSKDLLFSIVKREDGGWLQLVSEGKAGGEWPVFPDAAVIGLSSTEADASVYAHLAARRGRALVDYAALLDNAALPTPLTTRFGAALASETSGTRAAGTSSITDLGASPRIIEATVTRGANNDTRAAVCFRGSSSSYANCWKFKAEFDRVSLHNTAGMQTQTGGVTVAAGVPTHLRVVDSGDHIDCYVNGERWLDWDSSTGAGNTWAGTACDTGASLSVTVDEFSAWGTVTLSDDFGPFPTVPDKVGAATLTDAMTGTNGTALATHNGAWTVHNGAFEISSNKARITTADTEGIATVQTGTVDHYARATITLPADAWTYPDDVYAAVVCRYTDGNNLIQARLLWQDGPSPEVEVWEYVAGAGELIGYVNLTGTVVSAGDYVLTLACRGAEVAAYLDGECVAQATTSILTGTRAGIGVKDNNPAGQPSWDDFETGLTTPSVSIGGTLTSSGALAKQTRKVLAGALPLTGSLVKRTARSLTGTLALGGALTERTAKTLTGTLASAGAVTKQDQKALGGTVTTAGTVTKQDSRALSGTLATAATADPSIIGGGGTTYPVALAGTLASAGALQRFTAKALLGTLTATGAIVRKLSKTVQGTLTPSGALVKQDRRGLAATAAFGGALATSKTKVVALTGTATFGGTVLTTPQRNVIPGGTLYPAGVLTIDVFWAPIPTAPEFGSLAETGAHEALLLAETLFPEFTTPAETAPPNATFIPRTIPPEAGTLSGEDPPEFGLRG